MASGNPLLNAVNRIGLVPQIIIGLMLGVLVGTISPKAGMNVGLLGELFVGALKAVAPVLVFVLVTAALVQYRKGGEAKIKPIIILYLVGTFAAAAVAVAASMAFPTALVFKDVAASTLAPPSGIVQVLKELLMKLVSNPINAIVQANYIGILAWALVLGSALRHHGSDTTRQVVSDLSEAVTTVVQWVIRFAPLGIFGLVSQTVAETGFAAFLSYGRLLAVLLGSMAFIALVVNPLIVWSQTRKTLTDSSSPACAKADSTPSSLAPPPPTSPSTWHWRRNSAYMKTPTPSPSLWAQPSTWQAQRLPSPS